MSDPTTTYTTGFPAFTGVVDIATDSGPSWIFPPALNTDIIMKVNDGLPGSGARESEENGGEWWPTQSFRESGERPDMILDSIYNLTSFEERQDNPRNAMSLGHEDVVIHAWDKLKLEWSGGDSHLVHMECYKCISYRGDSKDIKKACNSFQDWNQIRSFRGTVIDDQGEMNIRFNDVSLAVSSGEENPLASGYSMPMPELYTSYDSGGGPGAAICMLTLGWDHMKLNSRHSVPFLVATKAREAPRPLEGTMTPWPYEFSSKHLIGRQMMQDTDPGGREYGVSTSRSLDSTTTPTEHSERGSNGNASSGVIAGAVVGSLVGVMILLIAVWLLWKRRKNQGELGSKVQEKEKDNMSIKSESETSSLEAPPPAYSKVI